MVQSSEIARARKDFSVCVLDGDPGQMDLAMHLLNRAGFPAVATAHPAEALAKIRSGSSSVILADCTSVGMDSLAFLEKALRQDPRTSVILMSALHSVDSAIEAIKHGAYDYLCKPLDFARAAKTLDELAERLQESRLSESADQDWRPLPLSEMRRIHIQRVLKTCNGNRVRAARVLGIGRTSLYRFLKNTDKRAGVDVSARA
jgi:DNA-binding NtrC family response regulator